MLSETQVFDMMETDPKTGGVYGAKRGLELYGRVRHLCVLVCGGDGTVGWVSSGHALQPHSKPTLTSMLAGVIND